MADSTQASPAPKKPRARATKNRKCPYCKQPFTSSYLGRHLDSYVKKENPKPADGIHDVEKIRKVRSQVIRRPLGRSQGGRRMDGLPTASTPKSCVKMDASSSGSKSPFIFSRDIPDKDGSVNGDASGKQPRLRGSASNQAAQHVQIDVEQKLDGAVDTGLVDEVARAIRGMRKKIEELEEQQHSLIQENSALKAQVHQLIYWQYPRNLPIQPPTTIPIDPQRIAQFEGSVTGNNPQQPQPQQQQQRAHTQHLQQQASTRSSAASTNGAISEHTFSSASTRTPPSIEETSDQDADAEMEDDDSFIIMNASPTNPMAVPMQQQPTLKVPRTRAPVQHRPNPDPRFLMQNSAGNAASRAAMAMGRSMPNMSLAMQNAAMSLFIFFNARWKGTKVLFQRTEQLVS
ncbi:hypothetical protein S40288_07055, partial [Stachybotrys chartarum IBT 40288]